MTPEILKKTTKALFPSNTQMSFAQYLGVHQATVSKWFTGTLEIPHYAAVILAHLMERQEGGFDPFLDVDEYFKD
jgi:DNA-binding transcriptional regulator YdaS (Cro superfamily)